MFTLAAAACAEAGESYCCGVLHTFPPSPSMCHRPWSRWPIPPVHEPQRSRGRRFRALDCARRQTENLETPFCPPFGYMRNTNVCNFTQNIPKVNSNLLWGKQQIYLIDFESFLCYKDFQSQRNLSGEDYTACVVFFCPLHLVN